jgi:CheY-like chemotaxis protein
MSWRRRSVVWTRSSEVIPDHDAAEAVILSGQAILVVDDSDINRRLMIALLTQAGYAVETRSGGAAAVEAVSKGDYGLVLMDVLMPGTDGPAATRAIRALTGVKGQIPILALTANNNPDEVDVCLAAGMDGVIGKPIDIEALLSEVAGRLGKGAAPYDAAMDPELNELRERYAVHLGSMRVLFEGHRLALEAGASAASLGAMAAQAHSIVGSAGNLGFMAVSEAARSLEAAAGGGDVPLVRTALAALLENLPEPAA